MQNTATDVAVASTRRRSSKGRRGSIRKQARQTWERWAEFWSDSYQRPYWDKGDGTEPIWIRPHGWPLPELGAPSPNGGDDPNAPRSGRAAHRPASTAIHHRAQPQPVSAPIGVVGAGNSFLTNFAKTHGKWLWGGMAEVLHNSVDAKATTIDVQRFPEPTTEPNHPDFALRIDDDGQGMTYAEVTTMMQVASDSNFSGETKKVGAARSAI